MKFSKLIGTGFYAGYSKYFPGSCGTLTAIPFAIILNYFLTPFFYFIFLILFFCFSSFISWELEEIIFKEKDAKEIVIDEWMGFFISVFTIPVTFKYYFLAFIIFRLFDIFKPFPVNWADKNLGKGIGVVADDAVAGIYTLLILKLLF